MRRWSFRSLTGEFRQRARWLRLARRTKIINAGRHDGDADDTFQLSSNVAPTMMLAFWSTSSANAGSRLRRLRNSVRSLPPVMEIMRPLARLIEGSSINGLEIAATAALSTRFSRQKTLAPAHHGFALLAHDCENVGKIEIDQTFLDDKIANASHTRNKALDRP